MTRRRIQLLLLGAILTAVILWQVDALAYQWDYRACLLRFADHYPNVASLNGAHDRETYDAQAVLKCEGMESERRFESAESADEQTKWGLRAILAYTGLIEQHHIDSYRPDRASVYAGLGQYQNSLADYNFLIANNPDNYWMYENRANLYIQMGQPILALADYQALYDQAVIDPTNPQAYLNRIAEVIADLNSET
jgi:tetratricopeptide (TPR) repeat protein